jgi:tape measure domain-containing protein
MAKFSELIVKIAASTDGFRAGLREVNAELLRTQSTVQRQTQGFANLGSTLQSIGTGLVGGLSLPLAGLAAASVSAARDMDSLTRGLEAVNKSGRPTTEILSRLREVAKLPGLGFQEAVRGSINLQAAGYSASQAEKSLKAFGNALATVGKGKADLDGVNLALSQMASKGKISAEEINQLAERVPQIREAIKAAYGTADTGQLQKLGVDAKEFVDKISTELLKLPQVSGGVANSFENLSDQVQTSLAAIGKSLTPTVSQLTSDLTSTLGTVERAAEEFAKLPQPVQNAAIRVGGLATVLPILAAALGAALSNVKNFEIALGVAAGTLGRFSGIAAAAATSVSFAWDYLSAVKYLTEGNHNLAMSTIELEKNSMRFADSLRRQGLSVDSLIAEYRNHKIDVNQFAEALIYTAQQFSPHLQGLRDSRAAAKQATDAIESQKNKLIELGVSLRSGAISADEFTKRAGKILDLNKGAVAAVEFKNKLSELNTQFAAGQVTMPEYQVKLAAISTEHQKSAQEISKHSKELIGSNVALLAGLVLREKEALALQEQRTYVQELAKTQRDFESGKASAQDSQRRIQLLFEVSRTEMRALSEAMQAVQTQASITDALVGERARSVSAVVRMLSSDLMTSIQAIDTQSAITQAGMGDRNKRTEATIKQLGEAYVGMGKKASKSLIEVSTIQTNLAQSLSRLAFEGGKFGDVMQKVGLQIGQSLTANVIQRLLESTRLMENFNNILNAVIRNLTGTAASIGTKTALENAGSIIAPSIPSLPGLPSGSTSTGATAGASSVASAGITGLVGAIAGVATAASSIFGNFQAAAQNKSLDIIVKHTLETKNELSNLRADEFRRKDEWFTKLDDLFRFEWSKLDDITNAVRALPQMEFAGGGGGFNVTVNGGMIFGQNAISQLADALLAEFRIRGVLPR